MTAQKPVFTLSIEETPGNSRQHGFHLGTIEALARQIAKETFHNRVKHGQPVVTVALKRDFKLFDVYYGDKWDSEYAADNLACIGE